MLKPAALALFLTVAAAAKPAAAQNIVGTLDDLQQAQELCYRATETTVADRTILTERGWEFVTVAAADGTRTKSDVLYFHPDNPSFILINAKNSSCHASTLVNDASLFDQYLAAFESYSPDYHEGRYMFCAEGRVGGLMQRSGTKGPIISAFFSTQVESGRCLSS